MRFVDEPYSYLWHFLLALLVNCSGRGLVMDDTHGWIGLYSTHHQLPPCPCVIHIIVEIMVATIIILHVVIFQWLMDVPYGIFVVAWDSTSWMKTHGLILVVNTSRHFILQKGCHLALLGWLMSLQWPSWSPINSSIPLLPSHFPIFSFLTFSSLLVLQPSSSNPLPSLVLFV